MLARNTHVACRRVLKRRNIDNLVAEARGVAGFSRAGTIAVNRDAISRQRRPSIINAVIAELKLMAAMHQHTGRTALKWRRRRRAASKYLH